MLNSQQINLNPGRSGVARGAAAALLAGIAWAASGVFHFLLVYPEAGAGELYSTSAYLIELAHAAAEAAILIVLLALLARRSFGDGGVGRAAFIIAFVGTLFMLLSTLVVVASGDRLGEAVLTVLFGVGLLGTLVGFILCAIAAWRAGRHPSWFALLLVGYPLLLVFMLSSYGWGGIALGVLWLAIAYHLYTQPATAID